MTIDDAAAFLARFPNGSLAAFEATRHTRGHKAQYTFEINGADASISWDLHDLNRLQYFDHDDENRLRGWRSLDDQRSPAGGRRSSPEPGLQQERLAKRRLPSALS